MVVTTKQQINHQLHISSMSDIDQFAKDEALRQLWWWP